MKEKKRLIKLKYLKEILKIKQRPSLDRLKDFIETFYNINNMPTDFYELVLQKLNCKTILKIIMQGNIYELISILKNKKLLP